MMMGSMMMMIRIGGHFLVGSIVIFELADYNTWPSKLVSTYEESAQCFIILTWPKL